MSQPIRVRAIVSKVVDYDTGLRTLWLSPERPVPKFRAGQFLHLALDHYDPAEHWPESRCFSIASPVDDRTEIAITVSAVGAFTRRMIALRVGDAVWLKLPYGDFIVALEPDKAVVLVGGGTGIAPFIPLIKSRTPPAGRVRVLYGVRHADLLIYRDDLAEAAARWPDLKWTAFVEEGDSSGACPGRLSLPAVLSAAHDAGALDRTVFYLSGPPAMISTLHAGLTSSGVQAANIRVDAWE